MAIQQIQPDVILPKTKKIQRYVALLSQAGTSNPTAIELQNTTGQTVTWTRQDIGVYMSSLQIIGAGRALASQQVYGSQILMGNETGYVEIGTVTLAGLASDDKLNNTTVVIELYTTYE